MGYIKVMRIHWRTIVFLLTPLVFLPIAVVRPTQVSKAAYGVIIMAIFWATEVVPIPVTSLLPVVIFPILGVMGAKELSQNYLKDRNMLILASLMVAASVEKCNLHRRISLRVIKLIGARRPRIMLGFMLPTWLLSMWISNTATTAIMFPVAQSILEQFETNTSCADEMNGINSSDDIVIELQTVVGHANKNLSGNEDDVDEVVEDTLEENAIEESSLRRKQAVTPAQHRKNELFRKGLCLSIAYACNVGGSATLIGTGTNMVFKDISDEIFSSHGVDNPITFASWFAFWIPASFLGLIVAWVWLQLQYSGIRSLLGRDEDESPETTANVSRVIQAEYDKLGPFTFAEAANSFAFCVMALLWITRDPRIVPGWSIFFQDGYVTNATCAVLVTVCLFACPMKFPSLGQRVHPGGLLDWKTIIGRVSWGVLLLLGGGYALADVSKTSGLSVAVGNSLASLANLPPWVVATAVTAIVAGLTEFTSNVTTTALLLPILAELSVKLGMNPLYLMIHGNIGATFAFMLPIATAPNAIVFAHGDLNVLDMVKSGFVMNILCIIIVLVATHTWGMVFFDLHKVPWHTATQLINSTTPGIHV